MEISPWVRQDHQGLTTIPPNQHLPMLLEPMTTMACPSYGALIASWIMLVELGDSGGGLIMFGSLYLMRRRVREGRARRGVMKTRNKRRNSLVMKKTIWIVWSWMMNM